MTLDAVAVAAVCVQCIAMPGCGAVVLWCCGAVVRSPVTGRAYLEQSIKGLHRVPAAHQHSSQKTADSIIGTCVQALRASAKLLANKCCWLGTALQPDHNSSAAKACLVKPPASSQTLQHQGASRCSRRRHPDIACHALHFDTLARSLR